jgi:hypothetical protein
MLAFAPPSIAVVSFNLRCSTPIPHVQTGRPGSSLHRSRSKQAFDAPHQQTASVEIPIASDARPRHTSRGFLPWRFAYAGPSVRRATFMGPPSANLHTIGHSEAHAGHACLSVRFFGTERPSQINCHPSHSRGNRLPRRACHAGRNRIVPNEIWVRQHPRRPPCTRPDPLIGRTEGTVKRPMERHRRRYLTCNDIT